MGWWWNTSPKESESQTSSPAPPGLPNSRLPSEPANVSALSTSAPTEQPRTLSREEQADAEWKSLIASLESDVNQHAQKQLHTSQDTSSPNPASSTDPQSPPNSIAPDSLYPDTMSCRSAFDYAFFCQSFGGQFVNVYRYGELRSCSEHWKTFWFCMKSRNWGEEQRKKAIRDHNRKNAIKYKTGPSSEDVWDVRTEPVGECFNGDFAALEREIKAAEEATASQKAASAAGEATSASP
ncbi:uncharacterized protein BO97DRAFT_406742 [Aspergillus homomorphus CBS 101889]|uniref:Early meiotic induction protein 1 n=1 Tax=Aspergillus homomorphus (strain CBS 101889) TaxID=1450537 RepID=A0A395HSE8_ASPHC|nr:hypothetical protein BO97DRAFT_406742 [Aspergillus homomorphus CBS 101889]RAL10747.1 hypothetical protein BO97DRAFT_406742 [Aspergillus homomorphus CBS 101889]